MHICWFGLYKIFTSFGFWMSEGRNNCYEFICKYQHRYERKIDCSIFSSPSFSVRFDIFIIFFVFLLFSCFTSTKNGKMREKMDEIQYKWTNGKCICFWFEHSYTLSGFIFVYALPISIREFWKTKKKRTNNVVSKLVTIKNGNEIKRMTQRKKNRFELHVFERCFWKIIILFPTYYNLLL